MEENNYKNMTVLELIEVLKNLPDNMKIVIPVVDEDNINYIHGFRYVRKAAILTDEFSDTKNRNVFCLNGSSYNKNISEQVSNSRINVTAKDIDF